MLRRYARKCLVSVTTSSCSHLAVYSHGTCSPAGSTVARSTPLFRPAQYAAIGGRVTPSSRLIEICRLLDNTDNTIVSFRDYPSNVFPNIRYRMVHS